MKYLLPSIYYPFFPKKVLSATITELKATCHACIKSPSLYKTNLKCCTYWPFIPNYIVGAILSNPEIKYKKIKGIIEQNIKERRYATPLGLLAPLEFQADFINRKSDIFGQSETFLCPYFDKSLNQCSMWIYRGSVCTSFYCESSYGENGINFWSSIENYMSYLESSLSQEVLAYNDYSPREILELVECQTLDPVQSKNYKTKYDPLATMTKQDYKKKWKHNFGLETEFYSQAYQFVMTMPKTQKTEVIGHLGSRLKRRILKQLDSILTNPNES